MQIVYLAWIVPSRGQIEVASPVHRDKIFSDRNHGKKPEKNFYDCVDF